MNPSNLTAKQLCETLMQLLIRFRYRCHEHELDAIEEAVRRLGQHERLVRDVLPDLRHRLAEAEGSGGSAGETTA